MGKRHLHELFLIDHAGHNVVRQERQFTRQEVAAVASWRDVWTPNSVFILLHCNDCGASRLLDRAESAG